MTTRERPTKPTTTTNATTATTQPRGAGAQPPPDGSLPGAARPRPVPPSARRRTPPAQRVWRSPKVVVGALGAAVAGVVVLADAGYDYDAVCVDAKQTRVADAQCGNGSGGSGGAHWYYLRSGSAAPRVGQVASGGTAVAPDSSSWSVHRGGVAAEGGTVSRGGFGGRLGTIGG